MRLVLDANEYIFSLGSQRERACEQVVDWIAQASPNVEIRLPRLIANEVRFELGSKYEWQGLKPADAFIAAYTEWVGADILVSENRHFLTRHAHLPFRVLTAHAFLQHVRS